MGKIPFLNFINKFRGIAILIIVAYHSMTVRLVSWEDDSVCLKVLRTLLLDCTILFIFISGYLFNHLLPQFSYKSYLKKKMKYVISPYLIMSAPAVLFMILDFNFIEKSWIYNTGLMNKSVITDILLLEITGSQWYHFWFIPMMIIFYLLAPAFRFVANNPGIYYIIPFIIIISFVVGRPADNSNPFQSFLYYLPVYLLGSFSSQFYSQVRKAIIKYWHFLVILFLFSSYIIYSGSVSSVSLFQKVILCYIVLALMINHDHSEAPVLEILAKYSFGIYFIHMYVIHLVSGIISFLELGFLRSLGIFSYFLFLALVTYISYLFLRVSKMILKENSRMIIGC